MRRQQRQPPLWLGMGLVGVWGLALAFRFWGLARFNTLVFDEVYFAKFGHNYLTQTRFFDTHPPLGKYLIAFGIAVKGFNTWGFRWVNALVGSAIPLVLAGIAYQLCKRPSFALITAALASIDGLLLVESRYALLNVHILFFGLMAHWLVLVALNHKGVRQNLWLAAAGISFGATIAVKWNGLGFLLGLYLVWMVAKVLAAKLLFQGQQLSLQRLSKLSWLQMFVYLPAIALFTYSVLWIPHLTQNPEFGFWQVHREIFNYHHQLGGAEVHPYCSAWYTWPFLLRPISYLYQTTQSTVEPLPIIGPPLPQDAVQWVYSVSATGNPILWWSSTFAILLLLIGGGRQIWYSFTSPTLNPQQIVGTRAEQLWVPVYLGVNYLANFLPWVSVSRCTFLYHYMPASLFSGMAIAWLVDGWLQTPQKVLKAIAITLIFASVLSFVVYLPLFLGLPLAPMQWQMLHDPSFR